MPPEERDHRLQQIGALSHDIPEHVLAVVVVPPVWDDLSHAEELTQIVETPDAWCTLSDGELVSNLVTESVADSPRPILLPDKADGEASFSVYKADHPATELNQPFLLVFRTRHIVTLGVASDVIE
jgi:hypothetical protein